MNLETIYSLKPSSHNTQKTQRRRNRKDASDAIVNQPGGWVNTALNDNATVICRLVVQILGNGRWHLKWLIYEY